MNRNVLAILVFFGLASITWSMRHCFNDRPIGRSLTLLEATEKCLWCGVRIFERGVFKADDTGAIYFYSSQHEIRIDDQIDVAACVGEKVLVEGLLFQRPFEQQLYLSDIAYVNRDAFVVNKSCYVNKSRFGQIPENN